MNPNWSNELNFHPTFDGNHRSIGSHRSFQQNDPNYGTEPFIPTTGFASLHRGRKPAGAANFTLPNPQASFSPHLTNSVQNHVDHPPNPIRRDLPPSYAPPSLPTRDNHSFSRSTYQLNEPPREFNTYSNTFYEDSGSQLRHPPSERHYLPKQYYEEGIESTYRSYRGSSVEPPLSSYMVNLPQNLSKPPSPNFNEMTSSPLSTFPKEMNEALPFRGNDDNEIITKLPRSGNN
eukprot:gene6624-7134_t